MKFILNENTNDTIKLKTVQSDYVVNLLIANKTYTADYNKLKYKKYINLYKHLADFVGLQNCPIFCAPLNDTTAITSSGIYDSDGHVIILQVPINEIKSCEYYNWADYLYFASGIEYDDCFNYNQKQAEENIGRYLGKVNKSIYSYSTPQVMLDKIKPEWVISIK